MRTCVKAVITVSKLGVHATLASLIAPNPLLIHCRAILHPFLRAGIRWHLRVAEPAKAFEGECGCEFRELQHPPIPPVLRTHGWGLGVGALPSSTLVIRAQAPQPIAPVPRIRLVVTARKRGWLLHFGAHQEASEGGGGDEGESEGAETEGCVDDGHDGHQPAEEVAQGGVEGPHVVRGGDVHKNHARLQPLPETHTEAGLWSSSP